MDFKNKIIIITGAGSGIGAACAKLFSSHGATIVLSDINIDSAQEVLNSIFDISPESSVYKTDVTKYEDVKGLIEYTVATYGKIDIIVNNAGIMNKRRVTTQDHSFEDWDKIIAVNQTGVFYCMKAALGIMKNQGTGNIVNMASLAGLKASGNNLAYSASKFAVVGMTKSAAMEYASYGIRINAVCPSYIQTPMLDQALEDQPGFDKKILRHVPMGRFGQASEIADAVLWLASEHSTFITGQTITLDGGLSL